jgi:hypothetical protein
VNPRFIDQHQRLIVEAARAVIAVADDSGTSLVDVISELERYIVQETKVGDAGSDPHVPLGRRSYTLVQGRLVEVEPQVVDRDASRGDE